MILTWATIFCLIFNGIAADPKYRLNSKLIPSEYEITITPYFNTGENPFTFDGNVKIKVTTTHKGVKQIKLHSKNLKFDGDNVTIKAGNNLVYLNATDAVNFDIKYNLAYINLASTLTVNTQYEISILYKGSIGSDKTGFFRSYYYENGQKKWLGTTHLEPVSARKVFPCFDEPEYKAKFTLIIDRPEGYAPSLTNTKLQNTTILDNGYVRERFYQTPIMSTYLVAFLVSEFRKGAGIAEGDHEISVWARPEAINQTNYALTLGKQVVEALSNYTNIDYYYVDRNLKLDHVGLLIFIEGAMENWGLIMYGESSLLYEPSETAPHYKNHVALIVAHETAHMWFGNLVTCHWWSDAWLNEGFATYFENYIRAEVEPDMKLLESQAMESTHKAYLADEEDNPSPMSNEDVETPQDIGRHFGTISYSKSASVIGMIHHWIGKDAFKLGIREYLNAKRFSVAYPEDLYWGLQMGVDYTNSLASYPGYTVADVMRPWVKQAGHPVLKVEFNKKTNEIQLTQKRFYSNRSEESDEIYPIPITYTTETELNFNYTKPKFIMSGRNHNLGKIISIKEWIIFNLQETGFYRVNYDEHLWNQIGKALRGRNRSKIHHLNRAKIVNDLFAMVAAKQVTQQLAYNVLVFLALETEYSVWFAALTGFKMLSEYEDLDKKFILRLMEKVIKELGFDEREDDSSVTLLNRMQITQAACDFGHSGCVTHVATVFRNFMDKSTAVPPSLRLAVYCQGLEKGTAEDYDAMYQRKVHTNVASEADVIQEAFLCADAKHILFRYVEKHLVTSNSTEIENITEPYLFHVIFTVLKEHFSQNKDTCSCEDEQPDGLYRLPCACISNENDFSPW